MFWKAFKIYFQCIFLNFQDFIAQTYASRETIDIMRNRHVKKAIIVLEYKTDFWLLDMTFITDVTLFKIVD